MVKQSSIPTLDELIANIDMLRWPIDFQGLAEKGLLIKRGPRYLCRDVRLLPYDVQLKIVEAVDRKDGVLLKFIRVTKRSLR